MPEQFCNGSTWLRDLVFALRRIHDASRLYAYQTEKQNRRSHGCVRQEEPPTSFRPEMDIPAVWHKTLGRNHGWERDNARHNTNHPGFTVVFGKEQSGWRVPRQWVRLRPTVAGDALLVSFLRWVRLSKQASCMWSQHSQSALELFSLFFNCPHVAGSRIWKMLVQSCVMLW